MPSENRSRSIPRRTTRKRQKTDCRSVLVKRALSTECVPSKKRKLSCDGKKTVKNEPPKNTAKKRKLKGETDIVHTAKRKRLAKTVGDQNSLKAKRNLDEMNGKQEKQKTSFCDCEDINERKEDFSKMCIKTLRNRIIVQNIDQKDKHKLCVQKNSKKSVVNPFKKLKFTSSIMRYKQKLRPRDPVIKQKYDGDGKVLKKNKHEEMRQLNRAEKLEKNFEGKSGTNREEKHEVQCNGRRGRKRERRPEQKLETTREGQKVASCFLKGKHEAIREENRKGKCKTKRADNREAIKEDKRNVKRGGKRGGKSKGDRERMVLEYSDIRNDGNDQISNDEIRVTTLKMGIILDPNSKCCQGELTYKQIHKTRKRKANNITSCDKILKGQKEDNKKTKNIKKPPPYIL